MKLSGLQQKWIDENKTDFSDLSVLFINCSLKKSPEVSNTEGLFEVAKKQFEALKVPVETVRAADHDLALGVYPDMREHGANKDAWPELYKKVMTADILIIGTPIWLGEPSSVCRHVIERLYGNSGILNKSGQYAYYGKVGGALITGNEDGVKQCATSILYALQHLGFTIPPQADAGWIGDIGPGPSYLDAGSGGPENEFTNRNTTFMTWNLLHTARMLKDNGGIPAHGNQRDQ
jgi:multimeric flavodoxin WrbA